MALIKLCNLGNSCFYSLLIKTETETTSIRFCAWEIIGCGTNPKCRFFFFPPTKHSELLSLVRDAAQRRVMDDRHYQLSRSCTHERWRPFNASSNRLQYVSGRGRLADKHLNPSTLKHLFKAGVMITVEGITVSRVLFLYFLTNQSESKTQSPLSRPFKKYILQRSSFISRKHPE